VGTGFNVIGVNREAFVRYYIGFDVPFADASEIQALRQTQEFAEMSVYPYYGSVQKIGDYIVVKFE
jgi:sporulation protein YlmC with PRC-barrel domain